MQIDIYRLRKDLIDYYGTLASVHPSAFLEVSKIENLSEDELIEFAYKNGFNIDNYIYSRSSR